jgi:DNA-binding MarR family transcriptional regulator
MRALGITSTSVVDYNLKRLAAKGLIEHSPGTTPAYRLPAKWR